MMTLVKRILNGAFFKFVIVGIISAITEYLLYFLFKGLFNYCLVANVVAFAITNVMTFALSRRFVFESSNQNKAEEAKLFTVCLIGALCVNQIVLWSLVDLAAMDDRIAKGLAIAITVIWNYFTRKHIVFKDREAVAPERSTVKNYRIRRF